MSNLERVAWYYFAGRPFIPRPRYLCFNGTLRCDLKCLHCGIWQDKLEGSEIDAAALDKIVKQKFFTDIHTAWLTGGEPTLRKDAGELARVMVERLPSLRTLGLATNGVQTERVISVVRSMREAMTPERHALFVHVSLDGLGEVHDRIRGREGAFKGVIATLEEIERMKSNGPPIAVGLNCVIQPENVGNLPDIHRFASERGMSLTFNAAVITDQIFRTADRAKSLALQTDEKKKVVDFLKSIISDSEPVFRYQYMIILRVLKGMPRPRRCLSLYSTININANGVLIPCPAASDVFPVNVCGMDVEEIWRSAAAREMRKRIEKEFCPSCMLSCSVGDAMSLREFIAGGWNF